MTNAAKFWDKIAEKYARDPISDAASYEHKLAYTRELFRPDMRVLEIGCGTGSTALLHAPHAAHILATDVSGNMIKIAETKRAAARIENVTFRQTTLEELPAEDSNFDMLMAHSILHLLPDPAASLRKMADRLKPHGFIVSSTACLPWYLWPIGPLSVVLAPLGLLPRVTLLRRKKLVQMHRDAGFKVIYDWKPDKGMAVFVVGQKSGHV